MRCFGDVFEKNIDVDVFDDVLQNAKHRANDASNDVNRPPLSGLQSQSLSQLLHLPSFHPTLPQQDIVASQLTTLFHIN